MAVRSSMTRADASPFPPEQVGGLAPPLRPPLSVFPDDDAEADARPAVAVFAGLSQFHHALAQFIPPLAAAVAELPGRRRRPAVAKIFPASAAEIPLRRRGRNRLTIL